MYNTSPAPEGAGKSGALPPRLSQTVRWLYFRARPETPFPGGQRGEETPVPIPNTAVKLLSGDGTVGKATEE